MYSTKLSLCLDFYHPSALHAGLPNAGAVVGTVSHESASACCDGTLGGDGDMQSRVRREHMLNRLMDDLCDRQGNYKFDVSPKETHDC